MTWYAPNKRNTKIIFKQRQPQALCIQQQKKKPTPASSQLKGELFFRRSRPRELRTKSSQTCADGWMQSLINSHAATRIPGKVLLLQNNLHDWGFNDHVFLFEEKPTTGRQKHSSEGLQRFEITTVLAVQKSDFCHSSNVSSSHIWLNELRSRKSSHLTHLYATLKSPLLQIYCT